MINTSAWRRHFLQAQSQQLLVLSIHALHKASSTFLQFPLAQHACDARTGDHDHAVELETGCQS